MRMNRIVAAIAICGLVFASSAVALEPTYTLRQEAQMHNPGVINVGTGPALLSDACPATDLGTISGTAQVIGSTAGSADDFDASALPCGDNAGGRDEIFQFAVDSSGFWSISTCDTANFDTTLALNVESGGGCPGDFVDCSGDGTGCGGFTSHMEIGLTAGTTYYVIVDGWSTYTYGDFQLDITNISCAVDADCDDGDLCNGAEVCDVASGECNPGPPACLPHQTCDPVLNECIEPDPCLTWRAGDSSNFFFPQANNCTTANWTFDDIQTSKHTTDLMHEYVLPFVGRSTPTGASPLGSVFLVDLALWDVTDDGACNPNAIIAGTECTEAGTIKTGGSDADPLHCLRKVLVPNNDGDFNKCEIDFFMGSNTGEQGAGWSIAGEEETIGGPGAKDEFGVNVFWIDGCPSDGAFGAT